MIRFHADAGEQLRGNVEDELKAMYVAGDRTAIDAALASGNHPWLNAVIDLDGAAGKGP